VAEFFAGIGLAHLGLQPDGWKIGFANDHAPDKVLFYRHNFAEAGAYLDERDVHEVKPGDLPKISLATASFPCTDLSLAGAQKGLIDGKQSSAYLHFIELITQLGKNRPPLVLLENVVGMITSRRGRDLELCLTLLQKAGYTVDVFVLDARHFVPQSRPRLFVVGLRSDLQPAGHLGDAEALRAHSPILRPQALMDFVAQHPNLPWSLRPLPAPVQTRRSLAEVLEQLPPRDPRWWSAERAARLYAQMSPAHQEMVQVMMRAQEPRYGTVFRRMRQGRSMAEIRTDGLAGCLRTPKGGSARQILVQASRGEYAVRLLTARECARLMGADDYAFPEGMSENKALFAFGDGVCVKAVQWISEHYLMPVATELIRGRVLRGS